MGKGWSRSSSSRPSRSSDRIKVMLPKLFGLRRKIAADRDRKSARWHLATFRCARRSFRYI